MDAPEQYSLLSIPISLLISYSMDFGPFNVTPDIAGGHMIHIIINTDPDSSASSDLPGARPGIQPGISVGYNISDNIAVGGFARYLMIFFTHHPAFLISVG